MCLPCIRGMIGCSVFIGVIYRTIAPCFSLFGERVLSSGLGIDSQAENCQATWFGGSLLPAGKSNQSLGCFDSIDGLIFCVHSAGWNRNQHQTSFMTSL